MITTDSYWLTHAQVSLSLLQQPISQLQQQQTGEGLVIVDLYIDQGKIMEIVPGGTASTADLPTINQQGGQVWPCFVDMHTHLDKGHSWPRSPNPDGSFKGALQAIIQDATHHWTFEDVYRRMEFGLQCSYAHGTQAIRIHLGSMGPLTEVVWPVFEQLRQQWRGRLLLQAVSLMPLDYYLTSEGEQLADRVVAAEGVLGAVLFSQTDANPGLARLFQLAQDRDLDVDLHVDESGNPDDRGPHQVATAKLRHSFQGQVVRGHCCSLAVQLPEVAASTIALVKEAGLGIVSLPMCNLYLQERKNKRTPRWRGITALHELNEAGVPVAVASDNCRDSFHAFGDHDMLEVFREAVRIAHLDHSYGAWPHVVTQTPASLMGQAQLRTIAIGQPANLVLFRGRSFSELLSRSQHDRRIIRQGREIEAKLPDYEELDESLMHSYN